MKKIGEKNSLIHNKILVVYLQRLKLNRIKKESKIFVKDIEKIQKEHRWDIINLLKI